MTAGQPDPLLNETAEYLNKEVPCFPIRLL